MTATFMNAFYEPFLRMFKRSLGVVPPAHCGIHCHWSTKLVLKFGKYGSWEGIGSFTRRLRISHGWPIGHGSGPETPVKEV